MFFSIARFGEKNRSTDSKQISEKIQHLNHKIFNDM